VTPARPGWRVSASAGRAALASLVLLLGGCGHRADPLPPLRRTPPALGEFRLAQRGDALEVSARAPRSSVDGVALERVSVEFLWAEGTVDLEKAGRRKEVSAVPGARVVETLPVPAPGTLVRAAARAVVGRDRGPRTLILSLLAQAPLEAPRETTAVLESRGVVVRWAGPVPEPVKGPSLASLVTSDVEAPASASEGRGRSRPPSGRNRPAAPAAPPSAPVAPPSAPAAPPSAPAAPPSAPAAPPSAEEPEAPEAATHGFHVYRRVEPESYGPPITAEPTTEHGVLDPAPPQGRRACYVVRAVASDDPLIESAPSGEACVDVRDIVPPAAPTGVAVLPREEGLEVVWTPSPETDLAGYRVYRASGDGERTRVAEVPLGTTTWLDTGAAAGILHHYTVSAVDAAGNESAMSEAAEARRR